MTDGATPSGPLSHGEQDFVVGVDGGGTGCRALVLSLEGEELGKAQGPPALIDPTNPGAAGEAIVEAVEEALARAGLHAPAGALWTGLAGAGRSGAREAVEIALRSRGLARETRVGMDVEGAHWDAFGPAPGVLLAVGTGSMVWGRDPEGYPIRVGGWGSPLSEEGSGYWFGLEGLRALVQAADHRSPPTLLTHALLSALHLPDEEALVPWVSQATKGEIGALAPQVLQVAAGEDPVARDILSRGLEALSQYLDVVRKAWSPWGDTFPLALAGGLLDGEGPLRRSLQDLARGKGGEIHPEAVIPVRGAAQLALELLREG